MVAPLAGDGRSGDGDASLPLLHHPVGDCSPFIDVAHTVSFAGIVQCTLGGRGLAGIDMSDNADVAQPLQTIINLMT